MKKTIVIISSLAVIILSAIGIYYTLQNTNNVIPVEINSRSSEQTSAPVESSSSSEHIVPPIKPSGNIATGGNASSQSEKKSEEEKVITENNGKTEIETIPSYSSAKPEAPPPPKPEGSTSDPNSKPTYEPDDTIKTPPASSEPKDGTKNDKGEIYIKGFGWVKPVTENKHDVAEGMNPNGNIIGK